MISSADYSIIEAAKSFNFADINASINLAPPRLCGRGVKQKGKCVMPKWLDNAVFYEIYPQSFRDSNADGVGDIPGILEKLDYIRELGCNAIWLNPCFQSPFGDAGYDVSDYCQTAPRYGTNEDLKRLFQEVHRRGMHILLDLIPGHTSVEHPWFRQSMRAEHNDFTDRYVWTDSIWEHPEGMDCLCGISDRDGACAINFFSHQPALNYGFYRPSRPWQQPMDAPGPRATLEAMKDVMRFWLQMGCDGFRVDMAHSLVKNDPEGKGTMALWQEVRGFLAQEFPDAAMVSEWGEPDKSLAGGFHMDFLLHFGPSHRPGADGGRELPLPRGQAAHRPPAGARGAAKRREDRVYLCKRERLSSGLSPHRSGGTAAGHPQSIGAGRRLSRVVCPEADGVSARRGGRIRRRTDYRFSLFGRFLRACLRQKETGRPAGRPVLYTICSCRNASP